MTSTLAVTVAGLCLLAALGFLGRRGRTIDLAEWTVGGRNFGGFTMWFLQAGESFTTFTFLGVAGAAFATGAAATYAILYIPLAFIGQYFFAPVLWRLGRRHGYLTQADFFAERYSSPMFGRIVAVLGLVFLLPYLQLQLTGLGLAVRLVTGSTSSANLSMVIATVLMVAFVLWSGIRGIANTAYLKDLLMIGALAVLVIAVPVHYAGGVGSMFHKIQAHNAQLLTVHSGAYDRTWWLTSVLISTIAAVFLTSPHHWAPMLSARGPRVIRRNAVFLPLYQIAIILPVIVGFAGLLVLSPKTKSNGVLLTLADGALPGWATGLIVLAAASSAIVPAAAMCVALSSLVANNLVRLRTERAKILLNHTVVVLAAGVALVLGISRPDLLANLQLLTVSGFAQLIPAMIAAVGRRRLLSLPAALLGLAAGETLVVWATLTDTDLAHINAGIAGLAVNVAVAAVAELAVRAVARPMIVEESQ
ncbi:sodium:solute symporter family protein [Actinoallomurus sp. CA-150999]|uniref:sodium:solute symporter family protein n=1 Tax=Actinoallomurus sp. CA-150999 TaxID=3239887 RepID=UPI003D8D1129